MTFENCLNIDNATVITACNVLWEAGCFYGATINGVAPSVMTADKASVTMTHGALLKNLGLVNQNGGFASIVDNGIFDVISPHDVVAVITGAGMRADLLWGNTVTPT